MRARESAILRLALAAAPATAAAILCCADGCGRSTVFECAVGVEPTSLDFGSVPFGAPVSRSVMVSSLFNDGCFVSRISLGAGSDPGFSLPGGDSMGIEPQTEMPITVTFNPTSAAAHASGTLSFETSDPSRPAFSIPLSATVVACNLSVPNSGVDFGTVTIGNVAIQPVTLTNLGLATCDVSVSLGPSTDPGFSVPTPTTLHIAPSSDAFLPVQFEVGAIAPPNVRTGQLMIASNDPGSATALVPLTAELPTCVLGVSPAPLDFGNITLNGSATDEIVLFNDGGLDCNVSGLALAASSDPDFSLPPQPTSFTIAPGQGQPVSVTFSDLSGATPPLLRTGTLDFDTGDPANPTAEVPIEAYVNVACTSASQWIYTVDASGEFARFDPSTLTFTDLGSLSCPTQFPGSSPFSMAVDQNAVAWVIYTSGELFRVDTTTVACQSTTFAVNQSSLLVFGMSFVFQPTTGLDTLYVAGFYSSDDLATISFPSLLLTPIAPVSLGGGELAGTGDGELWDFISLASSSGPALVQLDPSTADVIATLPLPGINVNSGFATKFWGGSFWIFIGNDVYQVPRATGVASLVVVDDGYEIVGAGVSTCAPVQ